MCYALIRPLLLLLEAERAHTLSLKALQALCRWHLYPKTTLSKPVKVMGLTFSNGVGLAAGLDKNGDYIDALAHFGFGFIEVGTVTPRPQSGNPRPRLFRLPKANALINSLGFNNRGVDYLVERLKVSRHTAKDVLIGVNIGKNRDTPIESSVDDYIYCMKHVYPYADYITVNISSPNTPQLRVLQFGDQLVTLLKALKHVQAKQNEHMGRYVPLVVKISPDVTRDEVAQFAYTCLEQNVDGIIATNTTTARPSEVSTLAYGNKTGGLSGQPLCVQSTQVIVWLAEFLAGKIPIIGVGGITTPEAAAEKIAAGASLVQLYTGLIYRGPRLVKEVVKWDC